MKKIIVIILASCFLNACQATKDALTLQKKNNSDEFLVEKKNPLVLPPDFGELPLPQNVQDEIKTKRNEESTISLNKEDLSNQEVKKDSELSSIEKSIMKKIKKK